MMRPKPEAWDDIAYKRHESCKIHNRKKCAIDIYLHWIGGIYPFGFIYILFISQAVMFEDSNPDHWLREYLPAD